MQKALAVAVGDHQFAGGVADDARRLVEGLAVAALCMGRADGLQQLAAGAEDAQSVIAAIGDVDSVCRVDPYFVRQREDVLTPGRDEMSVAVVDDDGGIGLAVDDIDAVLRVGGDAGGDAQVALGAPAGDGLVAVVPSTDDHGIFLRFFRVIFAISDRLPALASRARSIPRPSTRVRNICSMPGLRLRRGGRIGPVAAGSHLSGRSVWFLRLASSVRRP